MKIRQKLTSSSKKCKNAPCSSKQALENDFSDDDDFMKTVELIDKNERNDDSSFPDDDFSMICTVIDLRTELKQKDEKIAKLEREVNIFKIFSNTL